MDRLVFGMHDLNISQIGSLIDGKPHYSHPNYALDLCGQDGGIDFWFNKESGTHFVCTGSFGTRETGNTRFFVSCDEKGYAKKVMCADGKARVITLAMTHSNKDYPIYHIYQPQEEMYREGTSGKATGPHIHLEVAEGSVRTKYWDAKLKCYRMKGEMNPLDVFFILDGYTKVIDTKGLNFKHCTQTEVEDMKDGIKLAEYAKTQIGKDGTDYWNYFGYKDHWCSEFVSYCGYKCGFVPDRMPKADTCAKAQGFYIGKGQLHSKANYSPQIGDIAYFGTGGKDHTAIVVGIADTQIVVVEGNAGDSDFRKSKVCMTTYMKDDRWLWGYANPLTDKEGKPKMKDITKDIENLAPSFAQGGVVPDEGLEITVPTKGTYLLVTGHNSTPSLNTQWIVRTGGNTAFKISGTGTMVSVKVSDKNKILVKTTSGHPNVYVSRLDA